MVKEQVSKTEITIIGEQKLAQFSLLLPIRHYRNRKTTGAEMRLTIFSGIVTGGVPFSYWLIFSLVSCNYPRSLCENEFVPVTLSFLKWRILKERTELENQSDVLFIQAKKPSAPAPLPLVIEVSQKRESVKISSNLKHSCLYVYVSLCCFQGFRSLNFHSHRGRSPYSRRSHKALR